MIAYITLAFVAGVLAGITYMYLRYDKMMTNNLHELELLKLNNARIEGRLEILNIINGIEEETK